MVVQPFKGERGGSFSLRTLSELMEQTAQIILQHHPGLELQTDAGLMERYLGSLQGRQRLRGEKLPDDIEASDVCVGSRLGFQRMNLKRLMAIRFRQRITNWLTGFLDTTLRPRDGNGSASDAEKTVLVTSHGAYLTTLLSILLNRPFSFVIGPQVDIRASCYNTSIMRVSVSARQLDAPDTSNSLGRIVQRKGSKSRWIGEILSWADVDHLDSQWEDVGLTDDVR